MTEKSGEGDIFDWQKEGLSTEDISDLLGKHIFRWGMQSFPLKAELFKIQMKKACGQIKNVLDSQSAKYEKEIELALDALEDMVNQFAYPGRPIEGVSSITTGGLSALENAFEVLGYSDPQPTPHKQCNWAGCAEHSTCGVPSPKGYKTVCGKHSDAMHKGDLSGLAQEHSASLRKGEE